MKTKHSILLASLGLALATSATAQTIRISGSSAFRASAQDAIRKILNTPTIGDEDFAYVGTGAASTANLNRSSQAIFRGKINNQGPIVTIKCSWLGSASGVENVDNSASTSLFLSNATVASTAGNVYAAAGNTVLENNVDFAFSDVYQGSTPYNLTALQDDLVAVVPFKWLKNEGASASITNMTSKIVENLYASRKIALSFFSGNVADATTNVWAFGRDPDSGTRITMTAEAGIGALAGVFQNQIVASAAPGAPAVIPVLNTTPVTFAPQPFVAGNGFAVGNNGYTSGALVAAVLSNTSTVGPLIGYAGLSDSATAITNGATELTWNGVAYSVANVQEGKYTFWGYQHVLSNPTLTGSATLAETLRDAIVADITANPGSTGIAIGTMNVSRSNDGGTAF
jgi:hypothetical protein